MAARNGSDTIMLGFLLAAVPAWLARAWSAGVREFERWPDGVPDYWRFDVLETLGLSATGGDVVASTVLGLSWMLPSLVISLLVSLFWAGLFARVRGKRIDPGWLLAAWLYVLFLPVDLPPGLTAIGMCFGLVIGMHVFGGTGHYVASPALLGVLFVQFSYPGAAELSLEASWQASVTATGRPETVLAIASAAGALLLIRSGAVGFRTVIGGVAGVLLGGLLSSVFSEPAVAWHRHLLLGAAAPCLAFLLTDPSTASLTRAGQWTHGLLFGLVLVAIRLMDATHPEGSLVAALLAGLCVPLADYVVVRRHMARSSGRLELGT